MIAGRISEFLSHLSAAKCEGDAAFVGVSTDTRKIAPGNLFVALRGDNFDAHDFLAQAIAQGAIALVVERAPTDCSVPCIVVPDTRRALGELGLAWRQRFQLPVIGVTGSNGKTTVKEMITSILSAAFGEAMLATRGNLNNELGVPMTVFGLTKQHRAAVIEMGMNHPDEIAWLAQIAAPSVSLVNNAQREHQEFMASVEAVARENGSAIEALPDDGTAVFPADDEFAHVWQELAQARGQRKISRFGLGATSKAEVRGTYTSDGFASDIAVQSPNGNFSFHLQAAGEHNVRNALAASACALAAGLAPDAIVRGLEAFRPVNGRLQRKAATNGAIVIDDTYNANPDSVRAAIEVLAKSAAPRILVLGDMGEVGTQSESFHREIGAFAKQSGVEYLLALGKDTRYTVEAFGQDGQFFTEFESLRAALNPLVTSTTTVLVKGSRFMKMERVVQALLAQTEQDTH